MSYNDSRTRATIPTFPAMTIGGIDVWVRALRTHARSRKCYSLIRVIGKSRTSKADAETARDSWQQIVDDAIKAGTTIPEPKSAEGDHGAEQRLCQLLYKWTAIQKSIGARISDALKVLPTSDHRYGM